MAPEIKEGIVTKDGAIIKRRGCGASITWSSLPRLKDEEIFEALGVKEGTTMEEVRYMLSGNDKYDKLTAECEKNIDASFHK